MVQINVKRGLDIPIEGAPQGNVHELPPTKQIAFPCDHLEHVKFHLLVKPGDSVKIGQPLAYDKDFPERCFVSPAGGTIVDVRRGEKRRLLSIVIDVQGQEEAISFQPLNLKTVSREELLKQLLQAGFFAHIRQRPFNRLANPQKKPRSIFVKAIESLPFVPSAEMQVMGHEKEFQAGLNALQKLTDGAVNLVFRDNSPLAAFTNAENVVKHTVKGPHPAATFSLHIQHIDPIKRADDVVWTVNALDVVAIGHFVLYGKFYLQRIVSTGGTGFIPTARGFWRARLGTQIAAFSTGKVESNKPIRLISGSVLTGTQVAPNDFLGFDATTVSAVVDTTSRQFLSFLRLGTDKYTASGAYVSGHMNPKTHHFDFTTSQHGEERAFIDGSVYERVIPLNILPLQLVRAIMADDYELADELGLLEVDSEDFALAEFVDPSKIEMMQIVRDGLYQYAKDTIG